MVMYFFNKERKAVQAAVGESVAAPGLFTAEAEVAATPVDTADLIFNHPPWVLLAVWPQQQGLGSLPGRAEKNHATVATGKSLG